MKNAFSIRQWLCVSILAATVFFNTSCNEVVGGETVLPNSAQDIVDNVAMTAAAMDTVTETTRTYIVYSVNGTTAADKSELNVTMKKTTRIEDQPIDTFPAGTLALDTLPAGTVIAGDTLQQDSIVYNSTDSIITGPVQVIESLGWLNGGSGLLLGDYCLIRPQGYPGATELVLKDDQNGDQIIYVTGYMVKESFTNSATSSSSTHVTEIEVGSLYGCSFQFHDAVSNNTFTWRSYFVAQRLDMRSAKRIKLWDGTGLSTGNLPVVSWPASATSPNAYNWSYAYEKSDGWYASHVDDAAKRLTIYQAIGWSADGKIQFLPSPSSQTYSEGSGTVFSGGGCTTNL